MSEPESAAAKPAKVSRTGGPSFIRTVVLYLVVAATAAAISGLYFFSYVPAKLQYFLGMRFRTLAVAAGQLKSKAESLSAALSSAKDNVGNTDRYFSILIPDLKGTTGFKLDDHHIAWADLVAQASTATQSNFDDLVLADKDGNVVWQRERTTPRIGSLAPLLDSKIAADSASVFSLQWSIQTTPFAVENKNRVMPDTATSTLVNLDGRASVLLTQPVNVQIEGPDGKTPSRYFLGGFVSRQALQDEATHVPAEWVVLALVPFAFVFLSLPFIKLATVTSKERYSFGDVVFLGICAILIAALGGALVFLSDPLADTDPALANLAEAIDGNLGKEASQFLALTETIKAIVAKSKEGPAGLDLKECDVPVYGLKLEVCDFWRAIPEKHPMRFADLDVITWVDGDGMQVWKWTAKSQITPLIPQPYAHFADILAKRTWSLRVESALPEPRQFTIEPLRSPTTSDMAFAFAVPYTGDWPMMTLNVKPHSLVNPLVPPEYGFAIVDPDGRVLFHSTSALSLEENFLRELSDSRVITTAMSLGSEARWTGDYHGRRHRLYTRPVHAFDKSPWRLVTFRELEPLLAMSAARQSTALLLFAIYVLVLLCCVGLYLPFRRAPGFTAKDTLVAMITQPRDPQMTAVSVVRLGRMALILLLGIVLTYVVAPRDLTALYVLFVGGPIAAVILLAKGRWRAPAEAEAPGYVAHDYRRESIEVFLVALVVGALPAAGMTRLAHRLDDIRRDVDWLKISREQAVERERGIRAFVNRTESYTSETKSLILDNGFAMRQIDAGTDVLYSYQNQLDGIRLAKADDAHFSIYSAPWIEEAFANIRGAVSSSAVAAPPVEISNDQRSIRLAEAEGKDADGKELHYLADVTGGFLADLRPATTFGGFAILLSTFLLVYWARRTLSSRGEEVTMSIESAIRHVEAGGPDSGILLIGPPRGEKDRLAEEAVTAATSRPPEGNIRLIDAALTRKWVDRTLAEVNELREPERGGSWLWILVSNLETQLVDKTSRAEVFRLLEKLAERKPGPKQRRVGLIVTTTIDPMAHFSEIFLEERQEIYANAIPEVELNRTSLILSRFLRCYAPVDGRSPWNSWETYDPSRWRDTLDLETSKHLLAMIGAELKEAWAARTSVGLGELRRAVRVHAEPYYQLLWTSCSRSEKLVLIQLAQEGLINPKSRDTLNELVAKGMITPGPAPRLFNLTFRDFLQRIERDDVVQEWERMDGSGLWVVSGRLVASALMVGGLLYLLTQGISVQSLLPIISGSSWLGFPLLRSFFSILSPKKDGAALS
jgi:hypothetical protein